MKLREIVSILPKHIRLFYTPANYLDDKIENLEKYFDYEVEKVEASIQDVRDLEGKGNRVFTDVFLVPQNNFLFDFINKIQHDEISKLLRDKVLREKCESIKIFGSTLTKNCHRNSDIDLFVTLKNENNEKEIYRRIQELLNVDCDIAFEHEFRDAEGEFVEKMKSGLEIL